ncbi:DUF1634 domain-containing protein [Flavobacterium supellecticarium]|uniref:DUF1634 domain-containing protein n=1 Tax=Flavobacterium supellecticarium TaxID=2565924 RepID=A0A4V3W8L6_9FLAO|nr:DUF1634 domain-containing protein [Flavobacterium supellecticarium]THF51710.1 DUF1634 domain-containing protein [Flavobacterium supellecticarium]
MKKHISDTDVQQLVGKVLRYGVLTACFLAIAGGVAYLAHHGGSAVPSYHTFQGEGAAYTTFEGILKGAMALNPTEIIQFGVLALIATPILRVVLSLFAFILEKDKMYIVITLIVLSIIMTSIFGGLKV